MKCILGLIAAQGYYKRCLLHQVARIVELFEGHEALLDRPGADEPIEEHDTACFVVGAACSSSAKWLLSHNGPRALFVVINIPRGITKLARRFLEDRAILSKARTDRQHGITMREPPNTYIAPVKAYSVVVSMSSRVLSKSTSSYT